jgi:DNA invertase Pin-like site-specific DNA recombinase
MEQALLYVRVSSKDQEKEGYSLDAQEKLGEEYALKHDLKIVKRWKVSESAWKDDRDAFNEMINYAMRHDEVRHIIFDITDRMTRNDKDKIKILALIELHDKKIHFSRMNKTIDKYSGSEDEFMLDIEVAVAKKMSNDISRKVKMGLKEKAEQGFYPSYAPIGYKNNLATHLIEVDEQTAPYIQQAFSLSATGNYSMNMIADILHKEGFCSRKTKFAMINMIHRILRNSIYYGPFSWNGKIHQGSHMPLISKELFDKVQNVLSGNFHPHPIKDFHFNNLIKCGICGCKVIGEEKKKKYKYYHCTYSKGRHKGLRYIQEDQLAGMFADSVNRIAPSDIIIEWLTEALRESHKNASHLMESRIKSLESQKEKITLRLSRLLDMKIDGNINDDDFNSKEQEYKNQLIENNYQISAVMQSNPNFYEDGIRTFELAKRLPSLYLKANYEEKAKILKFIASNFILDSGKLVPVYKKPFDMLVESSDITIRLGG